MNRRQWLVAAAAVPICTTFGRTALAQAAHEQIAGNLHVVRGFGGNVLVCSTASGLVLVDSGNGLGTGLRDALGEISGDPSVGTVINTHWHPDQTSGNAAFGAAGAQIVAHAKTRQRLAAGYYLRGEERYAASLPADGIPGQSFFTDTRLNVADVSIECGYLIEAHTDGDIYVRFAQQNVIAAGDVISPQVDPEIDWFGGGWIGGRLDALSRLLEISDSRTRFVPSYGPTVGRDYVESERVFMTTVFDRMVELIRQGMSAEDCIEAGVMDGLGRQFDDPFAFIDSTHRSLWAHHNALSHDIL